MVKGRQDREIDLYIDIDIHTHIEREVCVKSRNIFKALYGLRP